MSGIKQKLKNELLGAIKKKKEKVKTFSFGTLSLIERTSMISYYYYY